MSGWLLDTNVISELRRPRPNARVMAFVSGANLADLHVSVVTLAEIRFGIALAPDPVVRRDLEDWLERRVRPMFAGRVLSVSEDVMFRWRVMVEEGRRREHTFSQPDLLIAATALQHGLTVVSRDAAGYHGTGAGLLDPWRDKR